MSDQDKARNIYRQTKGARAQLSELIDMMNGDECDKCRYTEDEMLTLYAPGEIDDLEHDEYMAKWLRPAYQNGEVCSVCLNRRWLPRNE